VAELVQTHLIEGWEEKDEPQHLRTIRDRLIERENSQHTWQLLGLCRAILSLSQLEDQSQAHGMELRLTRLMVKQPSGQLRVLIKSQLYNAAFYHRERLVLQGHKDSVNNAAFSPDGLRIVTASLDDTARLCNAFKLRACSHSELCYLEGSETKPTYQFDNLAHSMPLN